MKEKKEKEMHDFPSNAELFLMRLYESGEFRDSICSISSTVELENLLEKSGFCFDTYQLTKALGEFINDEIEKSSEMEFSKLEECFLELL